MTNGSWTMWKKIGMAVVLIVVVLVLAAPAAVGWYIMRQQDSFLQRIAASSVLQVQSNQFSLGWLHSQSSVRLAADKPSCRHATCPSLAVDSTIYHGPVPFTPPGLVKAGLAPAWAVVDTHIEPASLLPELTFSPALPSMQGVLQVALNGQASAQLQLPAIRSTVTSQGRQGWLDAKPLKLTVSVPASHDRVRVQLAWPKVELVGESGGQMGLRGLHFNTSGKVEAGQSWPAYHIDFDALHVLDRHGSALTLGGFVLDVSQLPVQTHPRGSRFELRVSTLGARGLHYGPLIVTGQLQATPPAVLSTLRPQIRRIFGRNLPPAVRLLSGLAMHPDQATRLLVAGPGLHADRLLLSTPDGDITGTLKLAVSARRPLPDTFAALLGRLQFHCDLQVPAALVHSIVARWLHHAGHDPVSGDLVDTEIRHLVKKGLLVDRPDDDAYQLYATFVYGQLVINGHLQKHTDKLLALIRQTLSPF